MSYFKHCLDGPATEERCVTRRMRIWRAFCVDIDDLLHCEAKGSPSAFFRKAKCQPNDAHWWS